MTIPCWIAGCRQGCEGPPSLRRRNVSDALAFALNESASLPRPDVAAGPTSIWLRHVSSSSWKYLWKNQTVEQRKNMLDKLARTAFWKLGKQTRPHRFSEVAHTSTAIDRINTAQLERYTTWKNDLVDFICRAHIKDGCSKCAR